MRIDGTDSVPELVEGTQAHLASLRQAQRPYGSATVMVLCFGTLNDRVSAGRRSAERPRDTPGAGRLSPIICPRRTRPNAHVGSYRFDVEAITEWSATQWPNRHSSPVFLIDC